jgi:hypothetical protein
MPPSKEASRIFPPSVIPAKAGIQFVSARAPLTPKLFVMLFEKRKRDPRLPPTLLRSFGATGRGDDSNGLIQNTDHVLFQRLSPRLQAFHKIGKADQTAAL